MSTNFPAFRPPLNPSPMSTTMSGYPAAAAAAAAAAASTEYEEEPPQVNSIQDLYVLLSAQMNDLGNRMSAVETLMTNKLAVAENRLKLHDDELARKDEQIAHLTNTITNMQRSLNSIDSEKQSCNLIIAGVTEERLTAEEVTVDSDLDKVNLIFSAIGLAQKHLDDDDKLSRIGKQNDNGKPRLLQVVCASNEIREEIIKAAPKLKEKGGDLSLIHI